MPRVTVCIPSYNYSRFIAETIDSALGQTFRDLEVIVVDNCSTDKTKEVVAQYGDNRLRFFQNEVNIGFVRNLNRCLELARGEFVLFPGADDLLHPELIEKQVSFLDEYPDASFVFTGGEIIDDQGSVSAIALADYPLVTPSIDAFKRMVSACNDILMPSALVRRGLLEEAGGFNPDLAYSPDYEAWLKLSLMGDVGYLREPLVGYRIHASNLTNDYIGGGGQLVELQKTIDAVFSRPEIQALGLDSVRSKANLMLNRYLLDNIFFYRMKGGRQLVIENIWVSLRYAPSQLLTGRFWIRAAASLILPSSYFYSRQRRKARALKQQAQSIGGVSR